MKKQFYLLFISVLLHQTFASFCGSTGVPFSFEVLPSGAPVLGCAQPTCIASLKGKKDNSKFLVNANGQADGFMREDDKDNKVYNDPYGNKLIANCSGQFSDLSCLRKDQWVGGIEYIDHPRQPLILQCCTFPGLRFSQDVGLTNVGPGEAITGGEVIRDGRQISFDVIANVRKVVDADTHIVSYEVSVRRMHCLPDPPEPVVNYFEKEVSDEITKVLTTGTDLPNFREEKTLKKEKPEELQGRKAFTDITAYKTDEKKQYKKIEFEEKESVERYVPNKGEVMQKRGEDVTAEITLKPSTTQSLAVPLSSRKSRIGLDNIRNGFSGENGMGFADANSPVIRNEPKAFAQQQLSVFGEKPPQLPFREPEFGFEPLQKQTSSQSSQPKQSHNPQPCAAQCQQTSCYPQRCNQGLDTVFGIPTLAPPLFSLTFPTLPALGFPTVAPQTFQPFIAQTYPTIAPPAFQPPLHSAPGYFDPFNFGHTASFNSPQYFSPNNKRNVNANGRLMQFSIAPTAYSSTTPASNAISIEQPVVHSSKPVNFLGNQPVSSQVTLKPLSTFEEFMARLGYRNLSLATLAPPGPLVFPDFTVATPFPVLSPLLYATTIAPESQAQMFIPRSGARPSQPVLYVPQQWSATDLDDTTLQRTGLRQL
ncbi:unnamed protein product [Cercopithifilaria johnstoni]|uniref:Uncharacterized protein n=1 Tax=Cercopithifilaria johnstoni TaxID=2874296 RepID=A0A8J2LZT2_9BILA|nr:unnamed protein product [Cercopithifilaria johnstoni]